MREHTHGLRLSPAETHADDEARSIRLHTQTRLESRGYQNLKPNASRFFKNLNLISALVEARDAACVGDGRGRAGMSGVTSRRDVWYPAVRARARLCRDAGEWGVSLRRAAGWVGLDRMEAMRRA